MFAHAITGCDTVCGLYNQGKKALAVLENDDNWDCLSVFSEPGSNKDEIARVGELFLLKLYGAGVKSKSLDKQRYITYFRSVHRTSLTSSGFKLESLPPTSAATKFHSYRAYLAVKQWQGNEMPPTEWGWQYRDGLLVPIETDRMQGWMWKTMYFYKSGLECTLSCTVCNGHNCKNSPVIDLE